MFELAGGCRVTGWREGDPAELHGLRVWQHFGRDSGAVAISLRVLELAPGRRSAAFRHSECDEVLYAVSGRGRAWIDGWPFELAPDTGVYVAPGRWLSLDCLGAEPLLLVSSRCPEPQRSAETAASIEAPVAPRPDPAPVSRLGERPLQTTGDRWYRELVDAALGSRQVTQFVGSIPPGRAPDHFHRYEEVLCVLQGEGRMWAGASQAPLAAGSCVLLPREQLHCVENTGAGELRLLGVFYPAGSPAVRYDAEPLSG